jgi:mono/diheme cytochrome c family protein
VWLFGLDGTLPPVQPGQSVSRNAAATTRPADAAAAAGATPLASAANLTEGKRLFVQACVVCHGEDGKGGHGGGAPLTNVTDLAATIQTVTAGRNSMPPFGSVLTPQEVRDVSAYVLQALSGRVP